MILFKTHIRLNMWMDIFYMQLKKLEDITNLL